MNQVEDITYTKDDDSQLGTAIALGTRHLDLDARESVGSRWSIKWSRSTGKKGKVTQRTLYQWCVSLSSILSAVYSNSTGSDCGYNHTVVGHKTRHNPVDFTGCLAHAEVTYTAESQKILRIRGYFEHNDACKTAQIQRFPPNTLHPSVFKLALDQLKDGVTLTDIQETNRAMVNSRLYVDGQDTAKYQNYRFLMKSADTRSLYRQFYRLQGVKVTESAHLNLHEWLDKESPQYNHVLAEAVFYYSERAKKEDRLKVCVATQEMKEAAWKYAHKSQIILDGTFGVCDKKLLLFIVMGMDEDRKGVPLAFLFFSAHSGNRHTAAGYNTEIIQELLTKWKQTLGTRNGVPFVVYVAITDTDLMERNALVAVFPEIWLLICKFHLRQSWRNHRNRVLKGNSPIYIEVKHRLARVEDMLIHTTTIEDARAIIKKEAEVLEAMAENGHTSVAGKGLQHLNDYLLGYWTTDTLWKSWSDYGRRTAARVLKCPIEGVLPTTNHLESFNGLLKRKHLKRWQRGGKRLRIDVLLRLLITKVLPSIFEQRAMQRAEDLRWAAMVRQLPGGDALLLERKSLTVSVIPTTAYLTADPEREAAAVTLLANNQISHPTFEGHDQLTFACHSSISNIYEPSPTQYRVILCLDGTARCSCKDFLQRGGACKHIRAALLLVNESRTSGLLYHFDH